MHDTNQFQPAFLRPPESARYLSISERHLRDLTRRGIIPAARLGKKLTLYARADLDAAVARFMSASLGRN